MGNNVVYEKKPMHHEDNDEFAKVSFDVEGFTDNDITVQVDEDFIVSITGERSNKLGDVFKIDRRFRLDKKTADVNHIDASITDGVLEVVVKKKAKVGPRVIKISTVTPSKKNSTTATTTTTDEKEAIEDENEVVEEKKQAAAEEVKEAVVVNEEKNEEPNNTTETNDTDTTDDEEKKEEEEGLEFEKI